MTWSSITSATGTWSSTGSAVGTMSNLTYTEISWQQLSGVTEGRGTGIAPGYDFRLTVNNQHPWKVNDSRPVYLADDVGANP